MPRKRRVWVGLNELAKRIGCSKMSIAPWVAKGMPGAVNRKYDLEACAKWIQGNSQQSAALEKLGSATAQLRARYYLRRCEAIEHDLAVKRAEYLKAEDVRREIGQELARLKTGLYTLPSLIEAVLGVEAGRSAREKVDEVLTGLAAFGGRRRVELIRERAAVTGKDTE